MWDLVDAGGKRNLECDFADKRLTQRAVSIAECLSVKYGEPLSKVFKSASDLKRGYEFFFLPKTTFEKLTQPSFKQTALQINGIPVVLAVGDTSRATWLLDCTLSRQRTQRSLLVL
ncbi:MAG: IS4/Tn5 family transposase DNA-binding protein [Brasilonema sp.]